VGVLSREVEIQADITLWEPPRRVEFVITGLTERISGSGSFTLHPLPDHGSALAAHPAPRRPWYRRVLAAAARAVLSRIAAQPRTRPATTALGSAPTGGPGSRLTFELKVAPGGPMAPMLELLMAPMLEPAAQNLAGGIRQALEEV
jgi:hypothetical protein